MGVVDVTDVVLFAMLALLIGIEQVRPARAFEHVPGWRLKRVAFTITCLHNTLPVR